MRAFVLKMKIKDRKGIILAGGSGSRLSPLTIASSKQLLPVYDKPMIYYPLSTLMLAGIREILLITTAEFVQSFQTLLGNGERLGIKLEYQVQAQPNGLSEAYILGEEFLENHPSALVLGDNIFYGSGMTEKLRAAAKNIAPTIFTHEVKDPERFGIATVDSHQHVLSMEEKPITPKSNLAVTGLYFLDEKAPEIAKTLSPSARGELEIVDLLKHYIENKSLNSIHLDRGYTWMDTGTVDSLLEAGEFVKIIQNKHQKKICCPEEIAIKNGWVEKHSVTKYAPLRLSNDYFQYVANL